MNHYFECTWAGVVYCTPVFGLVGGAPALVSMDKVEKYLFRSHEPVSSCISLNANDYGAGPENAVCMESGASSISSNVDVNIWSFVSFSFEVSTVITLFG